MRAIAPALGDPPTETYTLAKQFSALIIGVDQILTRQEAANRIGVVVRQLNRYLRLLYIYSPNFFEFEHPTTGGLNGAVKLTESHLPELAEVRELFTRLRNEDLVRVKLSQKYQQQGN